MNQAVVDYLNEKNIKPSIQRIAVMEYLMTNRSHPTADEIYNALSPEMPTLSKTTVYNTLRLFVEQGAAVTLTIDEKNANFDAETKPHAHFLCKRCCKIYDLPVNVKKLVNSTEIPYNFEVDETSLYVKGICKECKEQPIA